MVVRTFMHGIGNDLAFQNRQVTVDEKQHLTVGFVQVGHDVK